MRRRLALHTPLARWGFTTLTVLAIYTGQVIPALVTGTLAAYAWSSR